MGNDKGRFVLGILLGVLCGGGGAYWLASGTDSRAAESPASLERGVDSASSSGAATADSLTAPRVDTDRREFRPDAAASSVSDARVQSSLAKAGKVEVPSADGDASLWGTVVDEAGAPLAGVLVRAQRSARARAERSPSVVGAAAPPEDSAEDAVREALERFEARRAGRRDLTTDAAGAFRVDGVADGEWVITAYFAGYEFEVRDASYGRVTTGTAIRIVASPLVQIPVTVVGADGRAPESADITTTPVGERRGPSFTWTPSEAFIRLAPGRHEVTAQSRDGVIGRPASAKSETVEVLVSHDVAPEALHFELRERSGIRGRVLGAGDGVQAERVMVSAEPLAAGQALDDAAFGRASHRDNVAIGGEFQFLDLEPGRYAVGLARGFDAPVVLRREVEVGAAIERCDMQLPAVDTERVLRVMVLDPDGRPADGVHLSLQEPESTRSRSFFGYGMSELRTEDGAYLVELTESQEEAYFGSAPLDGEFAMRATHDAYGQLEVPLTRGQREVAMQYVAPATLTVTIGGYVGSGLEGRLSIRTGKAGMGGSRSFSRFTSGRAAAGLSTEGVQVFEGLSPGTYSVTLTLSSKGPSGAFDRSRTIDEREVEVQSGANALQLTIPALHSLRVHWAEGKQGVRMTLEPREDALTFVPRSSTELGEDGYAVFEDVPAGDYLLRASSSSSALQMQVSVPSSDIEFTPMDIDSLRVEITDPDGDLAKVGLRDGDLIVGTDGAEFSEPPSWSLLRGLFTTKSAQVSLLVERGGERLEIVVLATQVGDYRSLGGQLEPIQR